MAKHDYMQTSEIRGYQWPASALTGHEMSLLADWREKTGVPITQLLKQCILRIEKEMQRGV